MSKILYRAISEVRSNTESRTITGYAIVFESWSRDLGGFYEIIRKGAITQELINRSDVIDAHREKVKKAYPAYFDGYQYMDYIVDYLNGYENLYCIGRNGQHRYNNMDHSMVTAFYTVDNILNGVKDKSNIWNVNTEKDYHEEMKDE